MPTFEPFVRLKLSRRPRSAHFVPPHPRSQLHRSSTIANNTITNSGGDGIELDADDSTQLQATVTGNTISDTANNRAGIYVQAVAATGNPLVEVTLDSNVINNAGGDGIEIVPSDAARVSATVTNNRIANPRDDGIELNTSDAARLTATVANNQILNPGDDGIVLNLDGDSQVTATLSNNTIEDALGEGIEIDANGTTLQLNATVTGNQIRNIDDDGIYLETSNSAGVTATVTGNRVSNVTQDGIDLRHRSTTPLCLVLSGNISAVGIADNGFELNRNAGAGAFNVVNLATLTAINTGNFTFNPNFASFTNVTSCP